MFFKKKVKEEKINEIKVSDIKESVEVTKSNFSLAVERIENIENSDDLIICGWVYGKIINGDTIKVINIGNENIEGDNTEIVDMSTKDDNKPLEVNDCKVVIKIKDGKKYNIKIGTVIASLDATFETAYNCYMNTLNYLYVKEKQLDFTDEELDSFSRQECFEILTLANQYSKENDLDEASFERFKENLTKFSNIAQNKFLNCEEIYCVYSKTTKEPYLYIDKVEDGKVTSKHILFLTKYYIDNISKLTEYMEVKCIKNGDDKYGILNFIRELIMFNGVSGARILFKDTTINMNIEKAQDGSTDLLMKNNDLISYLNLYLQETDKNDENAKSAMNFLFTLLSKEMVKTRFLLPFKMDKILNNVNADGMPVIEPGSAMDLSVVYDSTGKPAVRVYTDIHRLKKEHGDEWQIAEISLSDFVTEHDCIINNFKDKTANIVITEELFNKMKNM